MSVCGVIDLLNHTLFQREEYIAPVPEAERKDMLLAYHAQLNSVDDEVRLTAAKTWAKWESVLFFFGLFVVSATDFTEGW